MGCFSQGCHNIAKAGIFKISNGNMCKNVMPCLEYKKFSLLRKEKRQLSYFLISKCNISKAIHEYVQEIVDTIWRHMEHMYINITLIPKKLELMSNGTTNAKLLENYFLATLF